MGSCRIRHALPVLASLGIFVLALEVLRVELHTISWSELTQDLLKVPVLQLAIAVLLTTVSYLALTGYDAFQYTGRVHSWRQIAGPAFLAYAISHSVGFTALSGASISYFW